MKLSVNHLEIFCEIFEVWSKIVQVTIFCILLSAKLLKNTLSSNKKISFIKMLNNKDIEPCGTPAVKFSHQLKVLLTHSFPMHSFSTSWKPYNFLFRGSFFLKIKTTSASLSSSRNLLLLNIKNWLCYEKRGLCSDGIF